MQDVNRVGVLWIRVDARVVPGALAQVALVVRLRPRLAGIVRTKDTTVFSLDDCPQAIRIRRRDGDAHDANHSFRKPGVSGDFRPGVAAVRRFENSTARAAALECPGLSITLPKA